MTLRKFSKIILIFLAIVIAPFIILLFSITSTQGVNRYACESIEGDKNTIIFSYSTDTLLFPVVTLGGVDFFNKPPEMVVNITDTNVNLSFQQDVAKFIEEKQSYERVTETRVYSFDLATNQLQAQGRGYNCTTLSNQSYFNIFINSLESI